MGYSTIALIYVIVLTCVYSAEIDIKNDKCRHCEFLVDTFQAGLKKTKRQHFSGGDTAWEEKNLGKYATSETRFVEIMEGICKKKSLDNVDKYNGLSDLEFKCSALLEDHEETVEDYYNKHQELNMSGWLCVEQLKLCCPDGHFGAECLKCPGVEAGAAACFGQGKCHGDGSRKGTGKCKCNAGYVGHMCRHCDADYYEELKTDTLIKCSKCFDGCSGGCSGPAAKDCNRCRSGYVQNTEQGCLDVNECEVEVSPCTGANQICINNIGSFTCECQEGYKRNVASNICELDIEASPATAFIRPDLLLRIISMTALAAIITLVIWRKSILLMVLTAIAVILVLIIEVTVNPKTIPDEASKILGL